ncbi:rabenosyn-5 [Anopheles maculipalpis]|uniref:rabenosyn-5 n=1 Tax=Anopheles maculipalpis TaxID=1496333 RepID=UPI0021598DDA|nr:rabenosyn-5 [Anopheles maculipalpis]
MDNPFDMHEKESSSGAFLLPTDGEILEGFLCPICKRDLRTPERLTVHVEHEHSEEQDLLKSLKEIFSLARQGILSKSKKKPSPAGQDGSEPSVPRLGSESGVGVGSAGTINNPLLQPGCSQPIGCSCEHMAYFKAVRSPRLERYAAETNKLIIRLDKLLDGLPTEPDQKKRHEQSKVPWIDGKLVKLCPTCAKSFGITRRQHHCRVCGSVMCDGCSRYLTLEEAGRLVNPTAISPASGVPLQTEPEDATPPVNESSHFRVCEHCMRLLLIRMETQDWKRERPLVRQYYEALRKERTDIEPHIGMYRKILASLYEGDVIYRLSDASTLREKIGRSAEKLDNVSKSLQTLRSAVGSREDALKKAIRLGTISYIKERMLSIPPLPVEEEIKKIQLRKRQETERRIERERQLALEAFERLELQSAGGSIDSSLNDRPNGSSSSSSTASTAEMTNGRYGAAVSTMDNWTGTQTGPTANITSDPLIDQINIVKGYIRQARAALRFEEVATLERNLSELTQEFYYRQRLEPADETTKQPETQ